jgi:O-antigen ligase
VSDRANPGRGWAIALWAALLAGILVAWSQRYWAVSAAITTISALTICRVVVTWARGMEFELPKQTPVVAAIGAYGFLQLAFHTTVLPELTVESSIIWALGACAFLLASQFLRGRDARRLFLELLLWSFTALAVSAMLQFYSTPVKVFGIFPAFDTVVGTFLSRNQFAALMEFTAPIALWYMLDKNIVMGGLCYAMILAATITASSRAGVALVCGELGVFLVLLLFARRRETRAIVSIFAGLALVLAVASAIAGMDKIKARFEDKEPEAIRRELLYSTLHLIAERPAAGFGIGTWRAVFPSVATFDSALLSNEAHNDWAQWTSEGGIPFLALMLALVLWVAKPAAQSIWGLGVLSVMVHSFVDYPTREPALLLLWFALAGALARFEGRDSALKSSSQSRRLKQNRGSPGRNDSNHGHY